MTDKVLRVLFAATYLVIFVVVLLDFLYWRSG